MTRFSKAYMQTLLITTTCVLLMNMMSLPAAFAAEDIWTEDPPRVSEHASGPERIDRLLERIAEDDPKKAKELRQLRKKDPEKFQNQIHQEMQGFFEKYGRGRQRQGRGERKHRSEGDEHGGKDPKEGFPGFPVMPDMPDMPSMPGFMGPMGPGPDGMRMGPMGPGKGRGSRSGSRGRGGRWEDRVQQRHEEFIKWFEENYPEKAKKLIELRDKNPEKYMKSFMSAKKQYGEIMEAQKKDPKYAKVLTEDLKLKQQRETLIRRLNSAEVDERAELLAELEYTVSKRFDLIIKKKQFRYNALKNKLARLKKEVEKREAELDELVKSKQAAVTERVNELAGKSEKINWE